MSWAKYAKEALARGKTVQIKPQGHSMKKQLHYSLKGEASNGAARRTLATPTFALLTY